MHGLVGGEVVHPGGDVGHFLPGAATCRAAGAQRRCGVAHCLWGPGAAAARRHPARDDAWRARRHHARSVPRNGRRHAARVVRQPLCRAAAATRVSRRRAAAAAAR